MTFQVPEVTLTAAGMMDYIEIIKIMLYNLPRLLKDSPTKWSFQFEPAVPEIGASNQTNTSAI